MCCDGLQTERAFQKQQNIRAGYVLLVGLIVVACAFCMG